MSTLSDPSLPPFLSKRGFSPQLITNLLITFWKHYSLGFLVTFSYSSYVVFVKAVMRRRRSGVRESADEKHTRRESISGMTLSTSTMQQKTGALEGRDIRNASLLTRLQELIKTKSWNNAATQEKFLSFCSSLKRILRDSNNTGAFLGYWTVIYFVLIRILHIRGVNRVPKTSMFVSSFLSGFLSQFIFVGVSWKIALYCALRALLGLTRLRKRGGTAIAHKPSAPGAEFLVRFPLLGALVEKSTLSYVLINLGLGYVFYYYPRFVDNSYKYFISSVADVSSEALERKEAVDINAKETLPCHPYHPKYESCLKAAWYRNFVTFGKVLKIYASVHLVGLLMSGQLWKFRPGQSVMRKYQYLFKDFIYGVLRSCLFLTAQIAICAPTPCFHNYICDKYNNRKHSRTIMLLPWVVGPFCIAFEHASRRSEIALYSLWRLLIAFINKYTNVTSYEKHSPQFERVFSALCFGLATALWIVVKTRDASFLKRLDRMILSQVFPPSLDLNIGRGM